jgi:hypothetical protein
LKFPITRRISVALGQEEEEKRAVDARAPQQHAAVEDGKRQQEPGSGSSALEAELL